VNTGSQTPSNAGVATAWTATAKCGREERTCLLDEEERERMRSLEAAEDDVARQKRMLGQQEAARAWAPWKWKRG